MNTSNSQTAVPNRSYTKIYSVTLDPGYYLFTPAVVFNQQANTTGRRVVTISATETTQSFDVCYAATNSSLTIVNLSKIVHIVSRKTVNVFAYQDSGATINAYMECNPYVKLKSS